MSTSSITTHEAIVLDFHSVDLSDAEFYRLCRDNPELRIELTSQRKLVIMSPAGSKSGWRNGKFSQHLANWTDRDGSGICFDSSAGFTLPNGAKRSPDAAWVPLKVWDQLSPEQQEGFAPICPDFVVELCSPTDSLASVQEKMAEYIACGAKLGWLFEPRTKQVFIYQPHVQTVCLQDPASITGDPVLPGFVFIPSEIW